MGTLQGVGGFIGVLIEVVFDYVRGENYFSDEQKGFVPTEFLNIKR